MTDLNNNLAESPERVAYEFLHDILCVSHRADCRGGAIDPMTGTCGACHRQVHPPAEIVAALVALLAPAPGPSPRPSPSPNFVAAYRTDAPLLATALLAVRADLARVTVERDEARRKFADMQQRHSAPPAPGKARSITTLGDILDCFMVDPAPSPPAAPVTEEKALLYGVWCEPTRLNLASTAKAAFMGYDPMSLDDARALAEEYNGDFGSAWVASPRPLPADPRAPEGK